MNNFKKWCDCAAEVKVKLTIELKTGERKKQAEQFEETRVNELAITITQLQEQIKQLSKNITILCAPRCTNKENLVRRNIDQMHNKTKQSAEETK